MTCHLCRDQGVITHGGHEDGRLVVHWEPCSCEKGQSLSAYLAANDPMYRLPELESHDDRARYS